MRISDWSSDVCSSDLALLRVIHASEMPDPGSLIERMAQGEMPVSAPPAASSAPAPSAQSQAAEPEASPQAGAPADFAGLIAMLDAGGKPHLAPILHDFAARSEERRLGNECGRTVRSLGYPH